MKIGYMCPFGDLGCGESEARLRFTYCCEKLGHTVVALDSCNYSFSHGLHAEFLDLDFIVTPGVVEQKDTVYPDVFSCFFYWCPQAFFPPAQAIDYISYMNKNDVVVGGYETLDAQISLRNSMFKGNMYFPCVTASVPLDWCIAPQQLAKRKIFYVGMNVERRYNRMRHYGLIKFLDANNLADIYGPKRAFGAENWKGFETYRGEITFDGKSILNSINAAGICLALHSEVHSKHGYVSNRIYEGAAAGAVIIADDNPYIKKYFGDSVYYIDIYEDDRRQQEKILSIITEINKNPAHAYEKACAAQAIFQSKLALDSQVKELLYFIKQEKEKYLSVDQKTSIHIIYKTDNVENFLRGYTNISKQYYKNITLSLICSAEIYSKISNNITHKHVFICDDKNIGMCYREALQSVFEDFFLFYDDYSSIQHNHIEKCIQVISDGHSNFAYSGTYHKVISEPGGLKYETLLNSKIDFRSVISWLYNDIVSFNAFEEHFSLPSVVFSNKILSAIDLDSIELLKVSPHLFLTLHCAIYDEDYGKFTYSLSAGYITPPSFILSDIFLESRGNSLRNGRSGHTSAATLSSIFLRAQTIYAVTAKNCECARYPIFIKILDKIYPMMVRMYQRMKNVKLFLSNFRSR